MNLENSADENVPRLPDEAHTGVDEGAIDGRPSLSLSSVPASAIPAILQEDAAAAAEEVEDEATIPTDPVQREQSAAEILEAACNYTPPTTSKRIRRLHDGGGGGRLYPSLVDLAITEQQQQEEEEEKKDSTRLEHAEPRDAVAFAIMDGEEYNEDEIHHNMGAAYAVATATLSSQHLPLNDYDAEMLSMKRAATRGDDHDDLLRDAPELRARESLDEYYERNRSFFDQRAVESIEMTGRDVSFVSSEEVEQEGRNFARHCYNHCFPMEHEARVISVVASDDETGHTLNHSVAPMQTGLLESDHFARDDVQSASVQAVSVTGDDEEFGLPTAESSAVLPDAATIIIPLPLQEDDATEATVIESAPIIQADDENDVPRWKYFDAAEAQVLEDSPAIESLDRKPAALASAPLVGPDEQAGDFVEGTYLDYDMDDGVHGHQQAEVLGIENDQFAHPLDMQDEDATAELVGQDYSVGIAVLDEEMSSSQQIMDADVEQTESQLVMPTQVAVLHDSGRDAPQEIHATLLLNDRFTAYSAPDYDRMATAEAVASVVEEDGNVSLDASSGYSEAVATAHAVDHVIDNRNSLHGEFSQSDSQSINASRHVAPLPAMALVQESEVRAPAEKTVESERSDDSVPDWLQIETARARFVSPPPPQRFGVAKEPGDRETSPPNMSNRIGSSIARSTSNVMESLFGESKPPLPSLLRRGNSASTPEDRAAQSIRPRTLLPWSVIFSPSTRMWVATLQTNQKALDSNNVAEASRSLRAFSLPTEKQAICLARSWTPPRMLSFSVAKACHIGQTKFALLRRPCHCKNCGVVVCRDCTVQWPSKMLPDTYNRKESGNLNVCKSCDWLCNAFRVALLKGNIDQAVALFETGNVNINSPFGNVKGELFFPVHCAVLGGSIQLLRWLVDEHCSPIKSLRVSGKAGQSAGKYTPIVTSKGRSLLGIAMEQGYVPIIRYLVVEKGLSLGSEKDITAEMLVANLQTLLHLIPADVDVYATSTPQPLLDSPRVSGQEDGDDANSVSPDDCRSLSQEAQNYGAIKTYKSQEEDNAETHHDECVICFDNRIDCVANPCGHQIMCMRCADNVSRCPVCAAECTFLKVYKP